MSPTDKQNLETKLSMTSHGTGTTAGRSVRNRQSLREKMSAQGKSPGANTLGTGDGKTQVFKDVQGQLKTGLAECQKVTKYCGALNDMVGELRKESNNTRD